MKKFRIFTYMATGFLLAAAGTHAERMTPPKIVLKLDDLVENNGGVHPLWTRVADYLAGRDIKAGFGIICYAIPDASDAWIQWVREEHDAGLVEFWCHGWDHLAWTDGDGVQHAEFFARSYDEQMKRFEDSQAYALDRLGFVFRSFGPGGSVGLSMDQTTLDVLADEPYIASIMYPQPQDNPGRALEATGKVAVLDRVWAVNLESSVGNPSFDTFLAGYNANESREYFVLQGHPMHWSSDAKWQEFTKIIDFLVEQNAVFMTPSELAAEEIETRGELPTGPLHLDIVQTEGVVTLTWDDASNLETGFKIYRSESGVNPELVATLPAGTETYVDESPLTGATSVYSVVAFNDVGASKPNTVFQRNRDAVFGPGIFSGYEMVSNGYLRARGWLEWVYVTHFPWVYSEDLGGYFWVLDTSDIYTSGTWAYRPRPR